MSFATLTRAQVFEQWIAALRSGAYLQGSGRLRKIRPFRPPLYCCVGVLCDIDTNHSDSSWSGDGFDHIDIHGRRSHAETFIPAEMREWLGLSLDTTETLYTMNDDNHNTFDDIADYLEKVAMPETLAKFEQQV